MTSASRVQELQEPGRISVVFHNRCVNKARPYARTCTFEGNTTGRRNYVPYALPWGCFVEELIGREISGIPVSGSNTEKVLGFYDTQPAVVLLTCFR